MNRIFRLPEVKYQTGLSKSSIYSFIAKGTFPKPILIGGSRAKGWVESDINSWIEDRIADSKKRI